jgi:hypothetical protein
VRRKPIGVGIVAPELSDARPRMHSQQAAT